MQLGRVLTLLALALALVGACKGDAQKCETGCRNYATLQYWKVTDAELVAAPADQRDALRKRKLGEFNQKLESGIDMCVSQCQSANNDTQIDCLIAAKTADQATECVK
ncbi:MAG TPA: hypothetical protein VHN14_30570 [Kofleriaceae bacterium]|jgi:hypothetical protein|nr:hypothetical protein [Kofleriaceae bacterium]